MVLRISVGCARRSGYFVPRGCASVLLFSEKEEMSVWAQGKALSLFLMLLYPLPFNGLGLYRWSETKGRADVGQLSLIQGKLLFFHLWSIFWFFTIWEYLLAFFWNSITKMLLVFWSLGLAIPKNNNGMDPKSGPKEVIPPHFAPSKILNDLKEWNTSLREKFESFHFEYFQFIV